MTGNTRSGGAIFAYNRVHSLLSSKAVAAEQEVIMGIFDFLVIAVVVQAISRIISRWLKTRDGVSQRRIKELEQRLHILEGEHMQDLQKRIGILEEIFVTEDIDLQRKIRHALHSDSMSSTRPENHHKF